MWKTKNEFENFLFNQKYKLEEDKRRSGRCLFLSFISFLIFILTVLIGTELISKDFLLNNKLVGFITDTIFFGNLLLLISFVALYIKDNLSIIVFEKMIQRYKENYK